jgi:hypothetical protein
MTRTRDRLLQGWVANGLAVADPLGPGSTRVRIDA